MTVEEVIEKCEKEMPLCYTEEHRQIVLGNMICDTHIMLLKQRKKLERENR